MSKMWAAIIIAVSLIYSLYFFRKAAGTLNLGKLNIVTVTGGLLLLQCFIGMALIMLGMNRHYTLDRLMDREASIQTTFYAVMGMAVLFPGAMYLFLRLLRVDPKRDYDLYLTKKTEREDSSLLFWLVVAAAVVCVGLLVAFLAKAGYVPLYKMLFHGPEFDMGTERTRLGSLYVVNQYVTNIMIHTAIPVMAYFTFSCAVSTKSPRWWILAVVLLAAAVIVKTYNFAKAPIIFFCLGYVFILIYHYGGIKVRWMLIFGGIALAVMVLAYQLLGASVDLTDIYNGVWGRLFFTQVGTLSYSFDLFPNYVPYLDGRSMGSLLLPLFGFTSAEQIRSGRLIMEIYGSSSVYAGSAGVMNSMFIGEAYANFGWVGYLVSILWVALIIAVIFAMVLKLRKTPATVTMFAYFTVYIATATQGGFSDFVYNVAWALILGAMLVCHGIIVWSSDRKRSQGKDRQS